MVPGELGDMRTPGVRRKAGQLRITCSESKFAAKFLEPPKRVTLSSPVIALHPAYFISDDIGRLKLT